MAKKKQTAFDKLTIKQRAFVIHYMAHFNAYQAAKAAGYKGSYKTVSTVGVENLAKPSIKIIIEQHLEKIGITPERIKSEFANIAMNADPADFEPWINGDKTLKELRASGVDTRLLQSASETDKGRTIKLLDRQRALSELARILGITEEVRRIKGGEDIGVNAGKILTIQFAKAEKPKG